MNSPLATKNNQPLRGLASPSTLSTDIKAPATPPVRQGQHQRSRSKARLSLQDFHAIDAATLANAVASSPSTPKFNTPNRHKRSVSMGTFRLGQLSRNDPVTPMSTTTSIAMEPASSDNRKRKQNRHRHSESEHFKKPRADGITNGPDTDSICPLTPLKAKDDNIPEPTTPGVDTSVQFDDPVHISKTSQKRSRSQSKHDIQSPVGRSMADVVSLALLNGPNPIPSHKRSRSVSFKLPSVDESTDSDSEGTHPIDHSALSGAGEKTDDDSLPNQPTFKRVRNPQNLRIDLAKIRYGRSSSLRLRRIAIETDGDTTDNSLDLKEDSQTTTISKDDILPDPTEHSDAHVKAAPISNPKEHSVGTNPREHSVDSLNGEVHIPPRMRATAPHPNDSSYAKTPIYSTAPTRQPYGPPQSIGDMGDPIRSPALRPIGPPNPLASHQRVPFVMYKSPASNQAQTTDSFGPSRGFLHRLAEQFLDPSTGKKSQTNAHMGPIHHHATPRYKILVNLAQMSLKLTEHAKQVRLFGDLTRSSFRFDPVAQRTKELRMLALSLDLVTTNLVDGVKQCDTRLGTVPMPMEIPTASWLDHSKLLFKGVEQTAHDLLSQTEGFHDRMQALEKELTACLNQEEHDRLTQYQLSFVLPPQTPANFKFGPFSPL